MAAPADDETNPEVVRLPSLGRFATLAYRTLGTAAFGLALAGVVLPGLPATLFLLVAIWAFHRGAPGFAARIESHPRLGPVLRNWRSGRIVPRRAKIVAVTSMAVSFAILWASSAPLLLLIGVGVILSTVAAYLLIRPSCEALDIPNSTSRSGAIIDRL